MRNLAVLFVIYNRLENCQTTELFLIQNGVSIVLHSSYSSFGQETD
jgi:hypothetical protein